MARPEQVKLALQSGVNTQATQLGAEGTWHSCNLIRWQDGYLQKIGGWERITDSKFTGISRGLHAYQDSDGNDYLVSGSADALQVYYDGSIYTLDLYGETHRLDVPFLVSATLTPNRLTVVDADADVQTGDTIYLNVPAAVDNITIYAGTYTVASGGSGIYSISIPKTVTSNDSGGGTPPLLRALPDEGLLHVEFDNHGLTVGDIFNVDVAVTLAGNTYFGPYEVTNRDSDEFYCETGVLPILGGTRQAYELQDLDGNPQGQISYATGIPADTLNWSIDNFGSNLVACYQNGPILVWIPPVTNTFAFGIYNAPSINTGLFVAQPQYQVVTYGASVGDIQDPLLIAFSDVGSYTTWGASATNQAGTYRLSRGSRIVGAVQAPQVALVWTDIDLWSMQYVGPPFVYSFNIMQTGCGLIAQRARTVLYGQTYWMSQKQFFTFGSGGVSVLPCSVWDVVFNDLDEDNLDKIWAWSNAGFNEVWFFYPSKSGGTGEVDSYVKYNVVNKLWDYGSLTRTSGIDQSVFGSPISIDGERQIQQHEIGWDDDGDAMEGVFAETGFIDLADGTELSLVSQVIPDFKWFGTDGYLRLTLFAKNYPGEPGVTYGPWTINRDTRFLPVRVRARQIAYRIEWGEATGFSARLGSMRYQIQPAGRR